MRKRPLTLLSFAALVVATMFVTGCRPSQQARRTDSSNQQKRSASGQKSSSVMMDSLLMVQNKLVSVIDTMSDILIENRQRIRDLEREVSRLKSMLERQGNSGGTYLAPPQQNYNAAPPTPPIVPPAPGSQISETPQPLNSDPNGSILAPPQSSPPMQPSPEDDKYGKALKLFNATRYEEALAAFDDLAHSSENSPYMPNFLYWRGESQYALKSYEDAITSFHEVLEKYPNSGKSDDAQFKIASSYEKLGNRTNAKAAYDRLILSYPESEYASRAKTRLQKLQ